MEYSVQGEEAKIFEGTKYLHEWAGKKSHPF